MTTVDETAYKFDVAFSFLAEDEPLAAELNDLLQDRLKTFLYSRRQEDLAGTDGEETFSRVFGSEAQFVVVLYREKWGQTRWTRIEETAIRGRAYDEGYDFTLFIPLDDVRAVPKWLPKTRIWFDLTRWGTSGAAVVIEQKASEQGASPAQESALDRANRLARAVDYETRRKAFLASHEGAGAASKEATILADSVQAHVGSDTARSLSIQHKRHQSATILGRDNLYLGITWTCRYSNTLDESRLEVIRHRQVAIGGIADGISGEAMTEMDVTTQPSPRR